MHPYHRSVVEIKPGERVEIALHHEIPDRCPMCALFTPDFVKPLKKDLLSEGYLVGAIDYRLVDGRYPHELDRLIRSDVLGLCSRLGNLYFKDGDFFTNEWGVKLGSFMRCNAFQAWIRTVCEPSEKVASPSADREGPERSNRAPCFLSAPVFPGTFGAGCSSNTLVLRLRTRAKVFWRSKKNGQKDMVTIQAIFHHHFRLGVPLRQLLDLLAPQLTVTQLQVDPQSVLRRYPGGSTAHQTD